MLHRSVFLSFFNFTHHSQENSVDFVAKQSNFTRSRCFKESSRAEVQSNFFWGTLHPETNFMCFNTAWCSFSLISSYDVLMKCSPRANVSNLHMFLLHPATLEWWMFVPWFCTWIVQNLEVPLQLIGEMSHPQSLRVSCHGWTLLSVRFHRMASLPSQSEQSERKSIRPWRNVMQPACALESGIYLATFFGSWWSQSSQVALSSSIKGKLMRNWCIK